MTVFRFGGMNNVDDPVGVGVSADPRTRGQYVQCVDLVNCDVDNELNIVRREGSALVATANVTSSWSNGTSTYCVVGGIIKSFDGTTLTALTGSPTLAPAVEFCQVNDVVAFSDGTIIGAINGSTVTRFDNAADWANVGSLSDWLASHAPADPAQWDGTNSNSNFDVDPFKLATLGGRCLAFYNGALYMAVNFGTVSFVLCTKTFDIAHMDPRFNVVAGFKGTVTMIKAMNGGLFVGTDDGVFYLGGDGVRGSAPSVSGFAQRKVLPFGVVYGSAVAVDADKIKALQTGGVAAVFLTSDGVYAAGDGGACVLLSGNHMPTGSTCTATIQQVGQVYRYVASIGGAGLSVNLASKAHSRYTGFSFTGFASSYGTNSTGVFLLQGDTDNGAQIDAYGLTPVADLGVPNKKRVHDIFLHVRTSGDMQVDLYVDEEEVATGLPFVAPLDLDEGARIYRAKLPKGAKGNNWQFRVANVDGARFTVYNLKATPAVSSRSI